MDSKRKVEVFSAGCAFCHEVRDWLLNTSRLVKKTIKLSSALE
jgi:hypothetical protein